MKLIETFIKRPVLSTVLSLIVLLFGVLSYIHLDTRFFPNVPEYSLDIYTNYPGASAKLIEQSVNMQIEQAVAVISGIDTLTSSASQGSGDVIIKFKAGVDFSEKASEVREKISSIRGDLPDGITEPVISHWSGDNFLLIVALTNPNMTSAEIRDYVNRYVANKIQEVEGVGEVDMWGSQPYAMRIWLDPEEMAARRITVDDVRQALENTNIQMPGGEIKSNTMSFPINEDTELKSVDEFNNMVIASQNGHVIRLNDIGSAKLGIESDPYFARYNGQDVVGMDVHVASDANPMVVSKAIRDLIPQLQSQFPPGMVAHVSMDVSQFYKSSVHEVYGSIILAMLCVIAVICLFLGSIRAIAIPVVTIPVCLIGAFCFMALFGFSINILTLLALVLAIGLVVDDSIVVLENIHRYIEKGLDAYQASLKGSLEIVIPVIAMTLTLVGVYAPIGFLNDKTALIMREFSFTLAGAVLVSGFLALTLTPMMCSKLLKMKSENRYTHFLDRTFNELQAHYAVFLKRCLSLYGLILLICIAIVGAGVFFYYGLPKQFLPSEDTGMVRGGFSTPTGSNTDYTFQYTKQLEDVAKKNSAVDSIVTFAYGNQSQIVLPLKPKSQREVSADNVVNDMMTKASDIIPGYRGFFAVMGPGYSEHGLEFQIMTSGDYDHLYQVANSVVNQLKTYPGLSQADTDMKYDSQQYDVNINREAAENMGIKAKTIDNAISILLGSSNITNFTMGGQRYKVVVQALGSDKSDSSILDQFYIKNVNGEMVPISTLATLTPTLGQSSLNHYDRLRSTEITAQLQPGYQLSKVVRYLQDNLPRWLPQDTKFAFEGNAKHALETGSSMTIIFLLGLLFIYLVLSAQFESFIDPFIILLTVPLSVIGGLFFLKLFGGSLNLYTDIGLVTLIGLVSKHGILITQFANQIRINEGLNAKEAVVKAASIRLRPILMTTGAMIFGAMPLLLATGFGANSRSQIGQVIVGGLLFGTFFSLILTPVMYSLFARVKRNVADPSSH